MACVPNETRHACPGPDAAERSSLPRVQALPLPHTVPPCAHTFHVDTSRFVSTSSWRFPRSPSRVRVRMPPATHASLCFFPMFHGHSPRVTVRSDCSELCAQPRAAGDVPAAIHPNKKRQTEVPTVAPVRVQPWHPTGRRRLRRVAESRVAIESESTTPCAVETPF